MHKKRTPREIADRESIINSNANSWLGKVIFLQRKWLILLVLYVNAGTAFSVSVGSIISISMM